MRILAGLGRVPESWTNAMKFLDAFELRVVTDAILCLAFLWLTWRLLRRYRSASPPGPAGLPFVGVAYQIPDDKQWLKFHEWTSRYGVYLPPSSDCNRVAGVGQYRISALTCWKTDTRCHEVSLKAGSWLIRLR